ncbi:collagen alpha-1(I) chain-like [Ammospiza nelsoni]|uniref:collagen alpha-1(I) chain-like n=1 Tax=Ammospiza nelsoni TaxID=2857394 RepID=UPI00286D222F|nr:collagen alpha-1(I) chain-like [Ammospiza nelsoni]
MGPPAPPEAHAGIPGSPQCWRPLSRVGTPFCPASVTRAATRWPFHRRETEAAAAEASRESRPGLGTGGAAPSPARPVPRPAAGPPGRRCPQHREPRRGERGRRRGGLGDAAALGAMPGGRGDAVASGPFPPSRGGAPGGVSGGERRRSGGGAGGGLQPGQPPQDSGAPEGSRRHRGAAGRGSRWGLERGDGTRGSVGSGDPQGPERSGQLRARHRAGAPGVRTALAAAAGARRLRPHGRGRCFPRGAEGPARLRRHRAPTGPGEQEWPGPSPAAGFPSAPPPSSTPGPKKATTASLPPPAALAASSATPGDPRAPLVSPPPPGTPSPVGDAQVAALSCCHPPGPPDVSPIEGPVCRVPPEAAAGTNPARRRVTTPRPLEPLNHRRVVSPFPALRPPGGPAAPGDPGGHGGGVPEPPVPREKAAAEPGRAGSAAIAAGAWEPRRARGARPGPARGGSSELRPGPGESSAGFHHPGTERPAAAAAANANETRLPARPCLQPVPACPPLPGASPGAGPGAAGPRRLGRPVPRARPGGARGAQTGPGGAAGSRPRLGGAQTGPGADAGAALERPSPGGTGTARVARPAASPCRDLYRDYRDGTGLPCPQRVPAGGVSSAGAVGTGAPGRGWGSERP